MRQDRMAHWIRHREVEVDKTVMLLEHFLLLHHDNLKNSTTATRKEICDFTGWTFKTVNKAIDALRDKELWEISEDNRVLTFIPLAIDEEAPLEPSEITRLIWENSSLSGTDLEVALAFAHRLDGPEGVAEASIREVCELVGRSINTVRDGINALISSEEWERLPESHKTRIKPNIQMLSVDRSANRGSESREQTGTSLVTGHQKKEELLELPFMLDDWMQMHGRSIRPFMRKRSFKGYAQRLMDETDIGTRKSRRTFTLDNITHIYEELSQLANIEIVDTLMHYQISTGGALDLRFLRPVAERTSKSWRKKPPARFAKEDETSGAYVTALWVWRIIEARQTPPPRG